MRQGQFLALGMAKGIDNFSDRVVSAAGRLAAAAQPATGPVDVGLADFRTGARESRAVRTYGGPAAAPVVTHNKSTTNNVPINQTFNVSQNVDHRALANQISTGVVTRLR
jgi:hypothetical protein